MTSPREIDEVIAAYPPSYRPRQIEALGNAGGFSGARFWRLLTPLGPHCLRRWPREHPDRERLHFIHAVLRHAAKNGFACVAQPVQAVAGDDCTFVQFGGHFWELSTWLPGVADYRESPSPAKLSAAMRALADFHVATEDLPDRRKQPQVSPGIASRTDTLCRWQSGDLERLTMAMRQGDQERLRPLATRIIAMFQRSADTLGNDLHEAARLAVPLQPCIRDIWDQHILFDGGQVTGLIDFGAMSVDSVATDIARLLGSLAADCPNDWQLGLKVYQQRRPLSDAEQRLVVSFDRSSVLLSGMNWLRWLYIENRVFPDDHAVLQRLEMILNRAACVFGS